MVDRAEKGDVLLVFDSSAWHDNGGDKGDNFEFWKEARVLRTYLFDSHPIADVRWLGTKKTSNGHFVRAMRESGSASR